MTDASTDTAESLVPVFEAFRDLEIVKTSPLYEFLNLRFIDEPGLAAPLLAAPPTERFPVLLLAAVHYLLRKETDAELAAYYPSLGGGKAPDEALVGAFRAYVNDHDAALRSLTSTRVTQTNEARRAAVLRPALACAQRRAGDRPLALVEVGCSSGLMLLADRYGYRYTQPGGTGVFEFGDAAAPELSLDVDVRGGRALPVWLATPLAIASRTGIDRNPIDAADPDQTAWLQACVWPDRLDRLRRLDAALAQAAAARRASAPEDRLDLRRGDLLDLLAQAVADAPDEAVVCVISSHVLPYLPVGDRPKVGALIAELSQTRDLVLALNEDRFISRDVFGVETPADGAYIAASFVDYTTTKGPTPAALAEADPHGAWLKWLA